MTSLLCLQPVGKRLRSCCYVLVSLGLVAVFVFVFLDGGLYFQIWRRRRHRVVSTPDAMGVVVSSQFPTEGSRSVHGSTDVGMGASGIRSVGTVGEFDCAVGNDALSYSAMNT